MREAMRFRQSGFTVLELMLAVLVIGIAAAVAVPSITGAMSRYALNSASQKIAAEIRSARFAAVAKNRSMRVRFNCPGPGQFRVVEVVNNPAIDNAANRCSETAYPFPDPDPAVAPNADGPVVWISQNAQFGAVQDVEITNRGRVAPLTGCPACAAAAPPASVGLTNGHDTQTIMVSASGQVQLP